jgi:hypothetical protein
MDRRLGSGHIPYASHPVRGCPDCDFLTDSAAALTSAACTMSVLNRCPRPSMAVLHAALRRS